MKFNAFCQLFCFLCVYFRVSVYYLRVLSTTDGPCNKKESVQADVAYTLICFKGGCYSVARFCFRVVLSALDMHYRQAYAFPGPAGGDGEVGLLVGFVRCGPVCSGIL